MHQRKLAARTLVEILAVNLLFFAIDWFSKKIETSVPNRVGRELVQGSHLLLVILMVLIVARFLQQVDEYLRLQMLENLAITTAVIFLGAWLYGSLEIVGFPRVSMFVICPALGCTYATISVVRNIFSRRSP